LSSVLLIPQRGRLSRGGAFGARPRRSRRSWRTARHGRSEETAARRRGGRARPTRTSSPRWFGGATGGSAADRTWRVRICVGPRGRTARSVDQRRGTSGRRH